MNKKDTDTKCSKCGIELKGLKPYQIMNHQQCCKTAPTPINWKKHQAFLLEFEFLYGVIAGILVASVLKLHWISLLAVIPVLIVLKIVIMKFARKKK